ncbi:MAG: amidophosphoribosyltransferase [Muribaculaceae bacterium]|nr:amidophosphoribosyltransferase [Muribaculaceae bacterium]
MELIKHECGIAMIRLRKPLDYYKQKYGTDTYGLDKLYLLMEKEHNRGQEAAGVGCVRIEASPGEEYIFRERAEGTNAIQEAFRSIRKDIRKAEKQGDSVVPFEGECYMGHLRYSTTGRSGMSFVHPFLRRNNMRCSNLLLCGNFNLTNVDEIFKDIVEQGQHPRLYADTFLLLEELGKALDDEIERLATVPRKEGLTGQALTEAISRRLDFTGILRRYAPSWDGGYVICGIVGNGDMWALRDPHGIRPAFYYVDEEVVVVASERPVIQTVFNVDINQVKELPRGNCISVGIDGEVSVEEVVTPQEETQCSFERIYFSRGSDRDIYEERKNLGKLLVPAVMRSIDNDLDNTVFSFIPNTAEVAYYGMMHQLEDDLSKKKLETLVAMNQKGALTEKEIENVLSHKIRREKVALKDIKLRTFIAESEGRDDLAAHVYDITYGSVVADRDNLVVIDDSIVRGTTLRQSIIRILDRLSPKRIVIVSSSPQVRYPDCYGIDISRMDEFIAFKAAMQLLRERGQEHIIEDVYRKSKAQENLPKEQIVNYVKEIYEPFSDEEIAAKITEMLTPPDTKAEVRLVFQTIEDTRRAIPRHTGDWYFSGDYPTPGGNRLVNKAFINFYEGNLEKRD